MAKGQKKQKQTDEILADLHYALSAGSTITDACLHAGISRDAYYSWIKCNTALADKFERAKKMQVLKARVVVKTAIDEHDVDTAKWYLSRKLKDEFSVKSELNASVTVNEKINLSNLSIETLEELEANGFTDTDTDTSTS